MKAVILNATLKNGDELSHTEALAREAMSIYQTEGIDVEMVRVNDYKIAYGISDDMGMETNGQNY